MTLARNRSLAALEIVAVLALATQAALLVVFAPDQWWLGFLLILAGGLLVLGAVRPALLVVVAIVARPLLDGLSSSAVGGESGANPAGMLGLLMVVALAIYALLNRKVFQPGASRAWLIVLAVSTLAAVNGIVGLGGALGLKPIGELIRIVALFAIYVLTANLFSVRTRCEQLFVAVGLSGVLPALDGLVDLFTSGGEHPVGVSTETIARIGGTFSGPIPFSTYLAITGLTLIFLPRERLTPWIRFPAIAVIGAALVGTYTREGWIVFLLGILFLGWRDHRRVVIATVAVVVALVLTVPTVGERVFPSKGDDSRGQTYDSYGWRIDTWTTLISKWANDSPVVGFGLKSVPEVNPRKLHVDGQEARGFDAHNSVVKLLVEGGVPLLAAYLALIGTLIATARRLARTRWPLQAYARIVVVLWTTVAIVGVFTDDILSATASLFAVLALTGALEGAYRHWRSTTPEHEEPDGASVPSPAPDRAAAERSVTGPPILAR